MDILKDDRLVHSATPPTNYIGSTIFLSYIIAALSATVIVVHSLYGQYNATFNSTLSPQNEKLQAAKVARARHVKIYAFLASVSFATLSYHMLMFLISHYLDWSGTTSLSRSAISHERLKKWMLDSTLFQDFAQELVQDAPDAVWTQAAIIATWFWNIWMAQKGVETRIDWKRRRKLTLLQRVNAASMQQRCALISFSVKSCLFLLQPPCS